MAVIATAHQAERCPPRDPDIVSEAVDGSLTAGVKDYDMTMLTHTGGPSRPAGQLSRTGAANAQMALIKRFCMGALTTLIVGGALGGIVALKVAIYLSRSNY